MANMEELRDEALEAAAGGAAANNINTTDWTKAHWQPQNHAMGSEWIEFGHKWYRVKVGDALSVIAQKYRTTPEMIKKMNPATVANINMIYAGDALIVG